MSPPTQPLRDEHRELLPHVEALRSTADMVGDAAPSELLRAIDSVHAFLTQQLIPHAQGEEAALYPAVQRVMGSREATATMSRDHAEVVRLAEELAALRGEIAAAALTTGRARSLRRVLYSLHAVLRLHFAKEEEVYLPLLDAALTPEAAQSVFQQMEEAAARARSRTGG